LTRRGEEIAALVSMAEFELLQQIEDGKKALEEPGEHIKVNEF
jgi:hypothetical protein